MSIVEFEGPPSSLVSWCERNWGEYKMPVDRGGGGHDGWIFSASTLLTPKSLPTGILYSPQFRFHQGTKMAARRTQRSTSTISWKNRGLRKNWRNSFCKRTLSCGMVWQDFIYRKKWWTLKKCGAGRLTLPKIHCSLHRRLVLRWNTLLKKSKKRKE